MAAARLLLAAAVFLPCLWPEQPPRVGAPSYSPDSVVNAANNQPGYFAPNTIGTIYGTDLSYNTRAIGPDDVQDGVLPVKLGGVRVLIASQYAYLLYVSPGQINFVIPYNLIPGETTLYTERDNVRGPGIRIALAASAPAPFLLDRETVVATHPDGTLVSDERPARMGGVIVLYAGGLGHTNPHQVAGKLATAAASIREAPAIRILLNGEPLPGSSVLYAGVTPGFAGLYQINLRLPDDLPENPEIRIAIGDRISGEGVRLPASN